MDRNGALPEWLEDVKDWAYEHKEPLKWATVGITTVAAIAATATVSVTGIPIVVAIAGAGMLLGGIGGGFTNVASNSGSFINGYIGGEFNGGITASLMFTIGPFAANFVGGSVGNFVTEFLNNLDFPGADKKSNSELFYDSIMAGGIQSLVCGGLDKLSISIAGGFSGMDGKGVTRVAGVIWDLYKMVFSIGAGTTVGYGTGPSYDKLSYLIPEIKTTYVPVSSNVF